MNTEKNANSYSAGFQVGNWHIDPLCSEIQLDKQRTKLEPRVMAVLVYLAERAGSVVTRQALEDNIWAGRIVGYDALSSTIIKLRKAFGDDSRHPRIIETIPKMGYRLIAEVIFPEKDPSALTTQPQPSPRTPTLTPGVSRRAFLLPGIAMLIALVVGLSVYLINNPVNILNSTSTTNSARIINQTAPTIAVLAFENMSSDSQQDYLSDGIAADLITGLSKISSLSVIARHSTFAYRNTETDVRIIGKELGARYVVEGSVRKAGKNVRISARLIDTITGYNLWADNFDGSMDNVFSFQDRVTSSIISVLKVKLTAAEQLKLNYVYTDNIEAYDNFLHGWQLMWRFNQQSNKSSREYLLKAIELDPGFARAYANLAVNYVFDFKHRWSKNSAQSLQRARESAHRAVDLDPSLPQAYIARGFTQIYAYEYDSAISLIQKGISLNPNFADAYALLAMALNFSARPQDAKKMIQTAMQLNPRHNALYNLVNGRIAFNLHNYDDAIKDFKKTLQLNSSSSGARIWLAAAYAHKGLIDDATWELNEIRSINPAFSIEQVKWRTPLKDTAQRKHLLEGLRKAGLR
ncbi:Adenylate cyclase [hydrothermal vent metagenome]|uniref:Adenylate cyclase n=1 Tax=hydrothermal vent metagenome TaxID=652676 RepID=A0A3B0X2U1_9ZZZZ